MELDEKQTQDTKDIYKKKKPKHSPKIQTVKKQPSVCPETHESKPTSKKQQRRHQGAQRVTCLSTGRINIAALFKTNTIFIFSLKENHDCFLVVSLTMMFCNIDVEKFVPSYFKLVNMNSFHQSKFTVLGKFTLVLYIVYRKVMCLKLLLRYSISYLAEA